MEPNEKTKELVKSFNKEVLVNFLAIYGQEIVSQIRLERVAVMLKQQEVYDKLYNFDTILGIEADALGLDKETFAKLTNEYRSKLAELWSIADKQMSLFDLSEPCTDGYDDGQTDIVEAIYEHNQEPLALPIGVVKLLSP